MFAAETDAEEAWCLLKHSRQADNPKHSPQSTHRQIQEQQRVESRNTFESKAIAL